MVRSTISSKKKIKDSLGSRTINSFQESKTGQPDPFADSLKKLGGVQSGGGVGSGGNVSSPALKYSQFMSNIPLLGGVWEGAKRLAFETLKGTTGDRFSEEEFERGRQQLDIKSGKILRDPGVQQFVGAAVGGVILGRVVGAVAPTMARFAQGGTATITRTATIGGRTLTTQRAFNVSTTTINSLGARLAAMGAITVKGVVSKGIGFALKNKGVISAVTGTQFLFTWMAADNIMSAASIFSRDTANAVRFGQISPGQAAEGLDDAQQAVNTARRFIGVNVAVNPLMWPFAKVLKTNSEGVQRQIDLQKRILGLI